MEIYEMIDLQDCPRCFGPSILEEEDHGYYVTCLDCGCQSATFEFKNDDERLEAAGANISDEDVQEYADLYRTHRVIS